jgi:hypothetical protein
MFSGTLVDKRVSLFYLWSANNMFVGIYKRLSAKKTRAMDNYCFWLQLGRWKVAGELPKHAKVSNAFVSDLEGTGSRGLRLSA